MAFPFVQACLWHGGCWGVVLLCLFPLAAQAQFASVRGRVIDASDGQPLPGAAVVVENEDDGRQTGTAADDGGYFILTRIPPGTYVLRSSFVGYIDHADTLALDFNARETLEIALRVDETALDEVVVEGEQGASDDQGVGFLTIRPSMLARVPTPGVSADLAAYLQTQPGVVSQGDRGGQLFIRGGTPTQNLIMLDGMPIFQPFHIVGFYSAFPADLIAFADVYTSGFGARYGGRLSSVIDVNTRNGNKQRVVGAASAAPFLSTLRLEIPFVPERVSILASARESVIERIAPDVIGQELPYRFGDRFAKIHAFLNRTSSLELTGLHTYDEGDVADTEGVPNALRWTNTAYGGNYTYLPEESPVLAQIRFVVSRLESRYVPFRSPPREADARTGGIEAQFIYYLGQSMVHAGLFGRSYSFRTKFGALEDEEFLSEGGLYGDVRWQVTSSLRLEPGLRMHSFPSRSKISFEPRLRADWQPRRFGGQHTFSMAWGQYRQDIIGLYNARDVTDAFVAWAPSPENRPVPRATHVSAGWKGWVLGSVTASVELYRKAFDDLAFAEYSADSEAGVFVNPVDGTSVGLDVKLEVLRTDFYGALNYGLGKVTYFPRNTPDFVGRVPERLLDLASFAPPHDRRHQVNLLARYGRGAYAVSAQWQFGSGLPFTQSAGFYEVLNITAPDATFHTQPGRPTLIQAGDLYDARLPAYHRLDLSAERRFERPRFRAVLQAGAINVYNRANLFDYDLFAGRRINQLPFIPSLGLSVEVK